DENTNNDLDLILSNTTNISYESDKNDSVEQIFLYNFDQGIRNIYVRGDEVTESQDYYLSSNQELSEDLLPPRLVLSNPENRIYNSKDNIPLNFTVDDNHTLWYTLNGSDKNVVTGNTTFNVNTDGSYLLTLYANDSYGNLNSTTVNFSVDSTPPSMEIISPVGTGSDNSIWFNISTNESSNTALYSLDNGVNSTLTSVNGSYFYNLMTVSEGNHNVTFYVNDSAGLMSSNTSHFNVSIDPLIDNFIIEKPLVYQNETLNLSVNITEENFDSVLLNLSSPTKLTSTFENITPNQYPNTTEWNLEFNQTDSIGIYNFTIFANDTMGNSVNYSDSFKASQKIWIELNNSYSEDLSWEIYYTGSEKMRNSFRNSSINLTLPLGIWDLNIEDNMSLNLFSVNISDNIEEDIEWEDNTSLQNITNNSFIFHKISSFVFNFSFDEANITIPFNSSIIENNLDILRCNFWNSTFEDCDSSWESILKNSTARSNFVEINTNRLSAFSIVEYCDPGCSWGECDDGTQTGNCVYMNCTSYQSSRSCEEEDVFTSGGGSTSSPVLNPSPECISNNNCSSHQICLEGSCINVSCECGYIRNHSCIRYECCSADDCESNQTCDNHTCIVMKENITLEKDLMNKMDRLKRKILEMDTDKQNTTNLILDLERAKKSLESSNYSTAEKIINTVESELNTNIHKKEKIESAGRNNNFVFIGLLIVVLIVGLVVIFKYA
ncbi:MAG: hypothetical protein ABEK17_03590, partial [Candidatus Aenigmatarchaeota archaeon]